MSSDWSSNAGDAPTHPAVPLGRQADASTGVGVAAGQAVMAAWAMAGLRTAFQTGWAAAAVWAAQNVAWLPLPPDPPGWLQVALWAFVAGAVAAAIRWLEARSRDTWWGRLGTRVGRLMMLGIVQQPTYSARGRAPAGPPQESGVLRSQ